MSSDEADNGVLMELANLENEFQEAEIRILKKQNEELSPLYERRAKLVERIPHFWTVAIEQAEDGIAEHMTPEDSAVFEHLESIRVERPAADPRDLRITLEFSPENPMLETCVLTKVFRVKEEKAAEGDEDHGLSGTETSLVSDPVPIKWKGERPAGNEVSFFDWFAWTGNEETDAENGFPDGDHVATFIAEDLYPNAVKYFTDAMAESEDEEDDASIDLEDDEDEEEEEDDDDDEDDEEDEKPPAKKSKK